MDSAARQQFLALLTVDLDDARAGLPEWVLYGPPAWFRTLNEWRGWVWLPCGYCDDHRYIVTDHDHFDGDGEFIGTEPQRWPCPACATGEFAACGVFPNGGRR